MADIPYLRASDIEARLTWPGVADAIRRGHLGPRAEIGDTFLHRRDDTMLSRSAWIDGAGIAVKSVTVLPGNPARGLPSIHGAVTLFEDQMGQVEAILDSALVTKWKTAADSLLGAQLLARPDSERLLILGAGHVAASLIEAYRSHWPDLSIGLWNRTPARAAALAERFDVDHVQELQIGAEQADIIASATMTRQPILRGAWLKPGTHIDLIGAFTADMREADDETLARARIYVDSRATTLDHIGELKIPLATGTLRPEDIRGDLYDLCPAPPDRDPEAITLYKNGGGAHLDLMTARHMLGVWRAAT